MTTPGSLFAGMLIAPSKKCRSLAASALDPVTSRAGAGW